MNKRIVGIFAGAVGFILGSILTQNGMYSAVQREKELGDKYLAILRLMNQWLIAKQKGRTVADLLQKKKMNKIAVYGMNYLGKRLVDDLQSGNIVLKYGIDKNNKSFYRNLKIVSPDSDLDEVDAIVVTAIFYFNEIKEQLRNKVSCPIISLEDLIVEIAYDWES